MSVFTKLSSQLWSWEPFRRLERYPGDQVGRGTKLFWLALYSVPEAKDSVPGLIKGSITTLAEACFIQPDDARLYLDRLLEDDLVEYDVERRVLRFTELPDCGESPPNGNTIRSWWRKFQNVPACPVRDAHVGLLWWLMQEWSRANGKPISANHMDAWKETFGRMDFQLQRPRHRKHVQTSLFESGNRSQLSTAPLALPPGSVSASEPPINNLNRSGNGSLNGSGNRRDHDRWDQDQDQDLGSPDPEGGGAGEGRPRLALVPLVPVDADDLAETLAEATGGKFPLALSRTQRQALGRAIDACADVLTGMGVLAVLRDYVKQGMPGFEDPSRLTAQDRAARSRGIVPELVATPGWLSLAIQRATRWAEDLAAKRAMLTDLQIPT